MKEKIEDLEAYLGVEQGFFHGLQEDDDWSFVIKIFSLFEAATTSLIVENLSQPKLQGPFSSLQMGTVANGKLAFLSALELIPESFIRYIETLGWFRNKFAHNISSSRHDIKTFIKSISSKRRQECRKNLCLVGSSIIDGEEISGSEFFNENPRFAIFISGQVVLHYMHQTTVIGQQLGKNKRKRLKQYSEEFGSINIKAYEYILEKSR